MAQPADDPHGSQSNQDGGQTLSLTVQCLCKLHSFTAPRVPLSSLPLKATTCHCDSCRHSSGALYTSDAPWPGDPTQIRNSKLRRYLFSDLVTVLFCGTCGSTLFFEEKPQEQGGHGVAEGETSFGVFTGALPNVEIPGGGPLVAWEHHMYLGDTKDGGAAPWLKMLDYTRDEDGSGGRFTTSRLWHERRMKSDEISEAEDWFAATTPVEGLSAATKELLLTQKQQDDEDEITIPVRCKCGGVELELLASAACNEFSQMPRDQLPRFVDPDNNKSVATFDVCDSCRLASGLDIFHWTFYLLKHIVFAADGKTSSQHQQQGRGLPRSTGELKKAVVADGAQRDPRLGTLKMYASSPDVQRYFCGQCSAVVFYACDDLSEQVDVAVGLLQAPLPGDKNNSSSPNQNRSHGGARADDLLSWKYGGKTGWRQDVEGGWRDDMLKNVERDVAAWRDRRGLRKNWRVVNDETADAKNGEQG
ncbi:GFA family protein [Microdochium nivale]|nr:GFA family protein [Microdochium nivale]